MCGFYESRGGAKIYRTILWMIYDCQLIWLLDLCWISLCFRVPFDAIVAVTKNSAASLHLKAGAKTRFILSMIFLVTGNRDEFLRRRLFQLEILMHRYLRILECYFLPADNQTVSFLLINSRKPSSLIPQLDIGLLFSVRVLLVSFRFAGPFSGIIIKHKSRTIFMITISILDLLI